MKLKDLIGKKIMIREFTGVKYFFSPDPGIIKSPAGELVGRGYGVLDVVDVSGQWTPIGEGYGWIGVEDEPNRRGHKNVKWLVYEPGVFFFENGTPVEADIAEEVGASQEKSLLGRALKGIKIPVFVWLLLGVAGLYFLSKIFGKR